MKRKMGLAISVLFGGSVLAVYVFAQIQTEKQEGEVRKAEQELDRFQQEKQKAVRRMLLQVQQPQNQEEAPQMLQDVVNGYRFPRGLQVSLCTAENQHNGYEGLPDSLQGGRLRIEMKDGSTQEIDLKAVKAMIVSKF